ncbi:tRNA (guanosine(46)-N7)-methyltransferase TrmB [Marinicrinis lubricantis]|uniref:tRNA (guanine-N(7)-)-methyltransferase n=1 Tax=Marinicrinis lubricantis TaxID=2086470 RepID=A0ABW1IQ63_9BACL
MRLRKRRDTHQYLEQQKNSVILQAQQYKGTWHEYFGNDHPIHVELGMGKGNFISELSYRHPEINYVGIDMYDELIRKASEKAIETHQLQEDGHIPNLALTLANINRIEDIFAPNEIERIYLNFSDPWPKKRHAFRRLTHPGFLYKYADILNEQGIIQLRTDSVSLFEFSLNAFANLGLRMYDITLDLHGQGTPEDHVFTEYERKFVSQGVRIHQCKVAVGKQALEAHLKRLEEEDGLRPIPGF